ncbi:hypothetical protein M434DRAFT_396667 [Hypoxylon sp. CO27-5]|nr:hypothetical protein M434DRAFT_396667 [Hypoxylon sp. CO27-5]
MKTSLSFLFVALLLHCFPFHVGASRVHQADQVSLHYTNYYGCPFILASSVSRRYNTRD